MSDNTVILEVNDLHKSYGDHEVLKGISTTIKKGDVLALIGPSGCGKSTFLRSLNLLEVPTSGHVLFEGTDMTDASVDINHVREKIGMVFQQFNLFPNMTIRENIMLAPVKLGKMTKEEAAKKAEDLLARIGLADKADAYPAQLSGGEQQRIAIAVALSNQPSILLADEPTGAVDTKTANQIFELFHKLNEEFKITIIIVTHDMALADKVERTVLISDGKISTEKIRKVSLEELQRLASAAEFTHEEYSVLDKAHRLQLTEEMLEEAGIDSNKVRIEVQDGKILIQKE